MFSVILFGCGMFGDCQVYCLGYGVMQLVGFGVFGLFKDFEEVVCVLQVVVEVGINYIDIFDFYGLYVINQLICKVFYFYFDDLCIVIKVSVCCDEKGNWLLVMLFVELIQVVEDNLCYLGFEVLEVVNLCSMLSLYGLVEGLLEVLFVILLELKE